MRTLRRTLMSLCGVTVAAALTNAAAPTHHARDIRSKVMHSPADYQYLHDPIYDLTPGLLRPDGRLINGLLPTSPDAQG